MIHTDQKKIDELLSRGVAEIIDGESLRAKLLSGKKLHIKFGIDPTSPNIHIGRAVTLLKLRDLQELGHQIIFIIGDFTGVIGDTSDKESERPMLTAAEVKQNLKTYEKQAGKLLDLRKVTVYKNSSWLKKLGFSEITKQADVFSVAQFIARENIAKRLDAGKRVSLREVLYPLMQGYDSVKVKADLELGGTDQKFNILAGRELQRAYGQTPQDIILLPLLEGLDGRKMSSSWGNTINLTDTPTDMYGKVMSLRDELILSYFTLATRVSLEKIEYYKKDLARGINPKDLKMKLAYELVRMYHGEKESEKAQNDFIQTFQKGGLPDDVAEAKATEGELLSETLVRTGIVASKGEFRRLIEERAVSDAETGEKIIDANITISKSQILKVGKKRFLKITL